MKDQREKKKDQVLFNLKKIGPGSYEVIKEKRKGFSESLRIPFLSTQQGRSGWQNNRDSPFISSFHSRVPGPGYYQKQYRTNAKSLVNCKSLY